jgi:hypothetical protein
MTTSGNDFEIAKAVADQLKDIEKERQQRILRWVAESLGLDFGIATTAERSVGGTASVAIATPSQANPDLHHRFAGVEQIDHIIALRGAGCDRGIEH